MPLNFFRSKKRASNLSFSPALNKKLDHKLIQQLPGGSIPSFKQLKYLRQFLSSGEKKLLGALTALVIITGIAWGGWYSYSHLTRIPASGGDYREVLIGEPKYINPIFASANDVDSDIASLVYSGLFRYNNSRELVPDLAESYKVSADGKTYDVTVKSNITWSDGAPFKIDDILYTFSLIQNPEVGSPLYESFQGVEIVRLNETTIRFILKQPFAPFIHSLTTGILPQHIWQAAERPTALRLAKANLQPVGTGPWKFEKWAKSSDGSIQTYTLTRNESYFGPKPHLKTITFVFSPDMTLAINKVHSQEIDGIAFPPRSKKDLLTSRNLSSYTLELPQYTALFFNMQDELLKDKEVRSALRSSINKDLIIKESLDGQGTPVQSPILPGQPGFSSETKTAAFNPDEANALLDKKWARIQPEEYFKLRKEQVVADFKNDLEEQLKATASSTTSTAETIKQELANADDQLSEVVQKEMNPNQTFYRKDKSNHVISIKLICLDTAEQQKTAEVVAKQWQLLGIHTTIQRISADRMSQEVLRGHTYQVLLYGELVGADPDPFPLWHSSQISYPGLNITQFNNRTADKLLEDARAATDPKIRAEVYKKFQNILADEVPAIFLYTPTYNYVINKDVQGIEVGKLTKPSDRFNSLHEWYSKKKFSWK